MFYDKLYYFALSSMFITGSFTELYSKSLTHDTNYLDLNIEISNVVNGSSPEPICPYIVRGVGRDMHDGKLGTNGQDWIGDDLKLIECIHACWIKKVPKSNINGVVYYSSTRRCYCWHNMVTIITADHGHLSCFLPNDGIEAWDSIVKLYNDVFLN